jgi:hypothetical protein
MSAMFVDCPHCRTRVVPCLDGTCPSCNRPTQAPARTATGTLTRGEVPVEAAGGQMECPACAEWIPADAVLCPYCGEHLDGMQEEIWRDGDTLVFRKGAELPPRCVKSNQPAERSLHRNLQWCTPWVYLGLLGGLLPLLVLVLVLQKKAEARIPLTDEWLHRRRMRILTAWLLCLAGVGLPIAGAVMESAAVAIVGGVIFLIGLFYAVIAVPIVKVKRIDDDYVWLRGIHPDYLAALPHFEDDRRRR